MSKYLLFLCCAVSISYANRVDNNAKLLNPAGYYEYAVQELFYELEKRGWCNFKMIDLHHKISVMSQSGMNVTGTASYTNGFLVSAQKIQVRDVRGNLNTGTTNGEDFARAAIRGLIRMLDVVIGYDVKLQLINEAHPRRYTGVVTHGTFDIDLSINKDMITNVMHVNAYVATLGAGSGVRMAYMPNDHYSQVLSLIFQPRDNWQGVQAWVEYMQSKMYDIAIRIPFPDVCIKC